MDDLPPESSHFVDLRGTNLVSRALVSVVGSAPGAAAPPPAAPVFAPAAVFDIYGGTCNKTVDSNNFYTEFDKEYCALRDADDWMRLLRFIRERFFLLDARVCWRDGLETLVENTRSGSGVQHLKNKELYVDLRTNPKKPQLSLLEYIEGNAVRLAGTGYQPWDMNTPAPIRVFVGPSNQLLLNNFKGLEAWKHLGRKAELNNPEVQKGIGLWLFMTFRNLCSGRMDFLHALIFWLAWIVQKPSAPTELCAMLVGDQGTGKTKWVQNLVAYVFGTRNCETFNNSAVFDGRFNASEGAILGFLEEMTSKNLEMLKSRITPPSGGVVQEKKHKDACLVNAYTNYIVASNGGWGLEQNARRFLVVPGNAKAAHATTCPSDPLFLQFEQQYEDLDLFYKQYGSLLGVWLCNIDLTSFNVSHPRKLPLHVTSNLQASMRYQSMSETLKWYTRQLIRKKNCVASLQSHWPSGMTWHEGRAFKATSTVTVPPYTHEEYRDYHHQHPDGLSRLQLDDLADYVTLHENSIEFGTYNEALETFLRREECFRARDAAGVSFIRNMLESSASSTLCPVLPEGGDFRKFTTFFCLK